MWIITWYFINLMFLLWQLEIQPIYGWLVNGVECHFLQYFSYIGVGNRSTWRKPLTYCKSLTNFITWCCIKLSWTVFELTTLVVIGTDCTGTCKSNYHMIKTMTDSTSLWSIHVCEQRGIKWPVWTLTNMIITKWLLLILLIFMPIRGHMCHYC